MPETTTPYEPFEIVPFDPSRQAEVRAVAEEILCREFGVKPDLSSEDDLEDVGRAYAPPDSRFLVAMRSGAVVATAGIRRISETDCELKRLYVLRGHRRQGLASGLVGNLLPFVKERGYRRILLELGPEMKDTVQGYSRYGFAPDAENLPRPGEFMSIRLAPRQG
jgi:putative acetyltransferase